MHLVIPAFPLLVFLGDDLLGKAACIATSRLSVGHEAVGLVSSSSYGTRLFITDRPGSKVVEEHHISLSTNHNGFQGNPSHRLGSPAKKQHQTLQY